MNTNNAQEDIDNNTLASIDVSEVSINRGSFAKYAIRFYPYVLAKQQISWLYRNECLLFMNWFGRLVFWIRQTGLVLLGRIRLND